MKEVANEQGLLSEYVEHFGSLIGDERMGVTFIEIVKGIINAGSLVCQRITCHSSVLCAVKDGAQRMIRFVTGESTKRSQMDAESLTAALREHRIRRLGGPETDELWLMFDGSDLRKPVGCKNLIHTEPREKKVSSDVFDTDQCHNSGDNRSNSSAWQVDFLHMQG